MPSSVASAGLLLAIVIALTGPSAVALVLGVLMFAFEVFLFLRAGVD